MGSEHSIRWSDEAVRNLDHILQEIRDRWTDKEVELFKARLVNYLSVIQEFPLMFPLSDKQPGLRRAVISSQTSVFYEVRGEVIYLVYLADNRSEQS